MGSRLSRDQKILKIDDLISRKVSEIHLASPNNSAAKFLISIRKLNELLIHFTQNYKNVDYILELKPMVLDPIFINIRQVLSLLNEVVLDLDVMIKDKKTKIDGKLDYIFETFLTKKGTLGKNKSETFLGFLEDLKKQALTLFAPILEELYKEPLLASNLESLRKDSGNLPQLTNSLVSKVHETLKRIEGNIGVFVRSVEDIYSLWDKFFAIPSVITFEEICAEYKKLDSDAAELTKEINKLKNKLSKKTLEYFVKKQNKKETKSDEIVKANIFSKEAGILKVLTRMHNFHVDFNPVKIELMNYIHSPNSSKNVPLLLSLLDKYFKLSDELTQIYDEYYKTAKGKFGGQNSQATHSVFGGGLYPQTTPESEQGLDFATSLGLEGRANRSFLIWAIAIGIALIIVIVILLWRSGESGTQQKIENIPRPDSFYKNTTINAN